MAAYGEIGLAVRASPNPQRTMPRVEVQTDALFDGNAHAFNQGCDIFLRIQTGALEKALVGRVHLHPLPRGQTHQSVHELVDPGQFKHLQTSFLDQLRAVSVTYHGNNRTTMLALKS